MQVKSENDIELQCIDCGDSFIFTENDQNFFKEQGYSQPKRCKICRRKKKEARQKANLD